MSQVYKENITQEYLKERLNYDEETGIFTWKPKKGNDRETKRWNTVWAGKTAGGPTSKGYIQIRIDGELYLAHRLAWLYMTGELPDVEIDHRYQIKNDNRWSELRLTDIEIGSSQNSWNRGKTKGDHSSKYKGVYWNIRLKKWLAQIYFRGKPIYLGYFDIEEEGYAAYCAAALKYHGEFACVE